MEPKEIPKTFLQKRRDWKLVAKSAFALHYICGIGGVAASCLAATEFQISKIAALGAAVAFGILGFAQPMKIYHQFMSALRILQKALLEYQYDRGDIEDLIKAVTTAEGIIQSYDEKLFWNQNENSPKSNLEGGI